MNIYLHVEISARELDSKLLLATLAAAKGHEVLVSNLSEILNGFKLGVLKPGIYHTKSLTPSKMKIDRHQNIVNLNCKITSIDEENGLGKRSDDKFERKRYSDITLSQSSAVFGWGDDDVETLKKIFPDHSQKIYKTGSPRVDLWRSDLSDYWANPIGMPKKPYLLVASNLGSIGMKSFDENFKSTSDAGYFQRDPDMVKKVFFRTAEDFKKMYEFIEAIKYVAKNNNGYDIVFRPHPEEKIKAWEIFLQGVPNTHVIRQDSITSWVKNAFAVMHNGCTTAIETLVSGKPLLTYSPFEMEYADEFFNSLGYNIKSKEELSLKANSLFDNINIKTTDHKKINYTEINELISRKLFIDQNETSAEKIIKIWESLDDKNLSKLNNWTKFYLLLKAINFMRLCRNILGKLFPNNFKHLRKNYKFPTFRKDDIQSRINKFKHLFGLKEDLECKFLSDRTVLIKKK